MAVVVKGKNKNRPYTVGSRDQGRQRERNLRTKTGWQARVAQAARRAQALPAADADEVHVVTEWIDSHVDGSSSASGLRYHGRSRSAIPRNRPLLPFTR
jgi:hypothetical protein